MDVRSERVAVGRDTVVLAMTDADAVEAGRLLARLGFPPRCPRRAMFSIIVDGDREMRAKRGEHRAVTHQREICGQAGARRIGFREATRPAERSSAG